MPLSEDEQRILQEMEQKLYEHDRAFVDRVRSRRVAGARPVRSSIILFVVGFAVVLLSFRSSIALATVGFLVMLLSAFLFERGARRGGSRSGPANSGAPEKTRPHSGEASVLGRRLRSRFWQQH